MVLGWLRFKRERQVSLGEKGMWMDVRFGIGMKPGKQNPQIRDDCLCVSWYLSSGSIGF